MLRRLRLPAALFAVALTAWLLSPGLALAQKGGGHGGGGHSSGGHSSAGHSSAGHSSGPLHHGGSGSFHHGSSFGFGIGFGYPFYGYGYPGYYGYGGYGGYGYPGYYGSRYYDPWYYSGPGYSAYPYVGVPDYSSVQPGYAVPAAPALETADNKVHVRVRVPADAKVWFEDGLTTQRGPTREFESPELSPGRDYTYDIRAQWREGGQEVSRTRHLTVHAGDRLDLNFLAPAKNGNSAAQSASGPGGR